MSEAPGSNSEAYFVGKRQLLEWVNDFLGLELKKVEELHSGWAYCQLVDAIFPGQVKISKVDFHAKFDYEYLKNFKVTSCGGVLHYLKLGEHQFVISDLFTFYHLAFLCE
mmetsp:Transcript_19075/g.26846  ORF Transcript_19075/g.26846 Transcript_19075/m.26846 type:complete len:110 (-) Transcript_19075:88-417(-)